MALPLKRQNARRPDIDRGLGLMSTLTRIHPLRCPRCRHLRRSLGAGARLANWSKQTWQFAAALLTGVFVFVWLFISHRFFAESLVKGCSVNTVLASRLTGCWHPIGFR